MKSISIVVIVSLALIGCAGPNPNPGERTTDMSWHKSNFKKAFQVAKPKAEQGEPWAQLRLGIFYENGWGVEADDSQAEYWYKKALEQKSSGNWAEGILVGESGKSGYFNQNGDARLASFNLAQLYYRRNENLDKALNLINSVIEETKGKPIFFCCEFAGGRSFQSSQFLELRSKITKKVDGQ